MPLRIDRFGNEIQPGGKGHKISFRDKVSDAKLRDVFLVESYKKYNSMVDLNSLDIETNTMCKCSVF